MRRTNNTTVCERCGGTNLEVKVWADFYSGEVLDEVIADEQSDCWCRDCEGYVDFITYKEFKEKEL